MSTAIPKKIAYVGLGNMGSGMASHLATLAQEQGSTLTVWNRSQNKYEHLRASLPGAVFATKLEEVCGSEVIFLSMINDAASTDIVDQLLAHVAKGTVIVDQSSVNPKTSIANEKSATAVGSEYISAPVFGRPDAAKAGKLIQILSGEPKSLEKVKPLVKSFSKAVLDIGHEVYKASTFKLMGNALIIGVIELLAETYTLGDAVGIDPDVFQEFIDMFFPTPSYNTYGRKIGHEDFDGTGGFRLEGGLKDANNIINVGADLGHPVPMPAIQLAKEHMQRAAELGSKDNDWSSLAVALREKAGLKPFPDGKGK